MSLINVDTALRALHMGLFPELYAYQPNHEYWGDFDPADEETEADYVTEHGPYEWDSGTIEWVALDIEQAMRAIGLEVPERRS